MTLTVADMRRILAELPDDALVVLSRDPEGNRYSPLHEVVRGMYYAQGRNPYQGEYHPAEEQEEFGPAPANAVPAVFLWPTA